MLSFTIKLPLTYYISNFIIVKPNQTNFQLDDNINQISSTWNSVILNLPFKGCNRQFQDREKFEWFVMKDTPGGVCVCVCVCVREERERQRDRLFARIFCCC